MHVCDKSCAISVYKVMHSVNCLPVRDADRRFSPARFTVCGGEDVRETPIRVMYALRDHLLDTPIRVLVERDQKRTEK